MAKWGRMKWNSEQLELGLSQQRNLSRRFQHRSQRRLQRASWWFDQMRRAVDSADEWQVLERGVAPLGFQSESSMLDVEEVDGSKEEIGFTL